MNPSNNIANNRRSPISKFINAATVTCLLSYILWDIQSKFGRKGLITDEELRNYNGIDRPELYLSILGNVFDVTKGAKHYGPGEAYNMFIGRDYSKGFQTGKMHNDDDDDNNISFELADLRTLEYWIKFYKDQYISKGKLIGKYYDFNGNLTPYGEQVQLELKRVKEIEVKEDNNKLIFPSCNIEWAPDSYTRVWCTANSGGVKRDWVGVPRRLFDVEKNTERCACIGESNRDLGMYEEYFDCDSESDSCYIMLPA